MNNKIAKKQDLSMPHIPHIGEPACNGKAIAGLRGPDTIDKGDTTMQTKELICVNCPKGCRITVTLDGKNIISIEGYSCSRGKEYAQQESIRPERILTTTIRIQNGTHRVLPVITNKAIPLDEMSEAMEAVRKLSIEAPVKEGQVIQKNFLDTGADLIASRDMERI